MSSDPKPFAKAVRSVRLGIKDKDDGESFICDEEPHMFKPEHGYGFNPLSLGQKIQEGKLEIVRKLGWGGYSSVWLARTHGDAYPTKYVAVKVLTVNATAGILDGLLGEVDSLEIIEVAKRDHLGYKHCIRLHDAFMSFSYHGPHMCIVSNPLGDSLGALRRRQPHRAFPVLIVKRIIKQTLLALDYLHRECGLIHTDVKPENTLVSLPHSDEEIARLLEEDPSITYEPRIEPDVSPAPIITVKSQPLPNLGLRSDMSNLDICLIDYGHATPIKKHLLEGVQPLLLRAPEVILGHEWSTEIDIWSVGCLVFEYLTGVALFQIHETSTMSLEDVLLRRIREHIGPFPSTFLQACKRRNEFFDEEGSLIRIKELIPQSIEECFQIYKVLEEKDSCASAAFIRKCLTIDPGRRPTALELLEDEWLKDA